MSDGTFAFRCSRARARVHSMDEVDGWKDRELKTILFALEAGLKQPESGAAYDAYVMLKDLVTTGAGR